MICVVKGLLEYLFRKYFYSWENVLISTKILSFLTTIHRTVGTNKKKKQTTHLLFYPSVIKSSRQQMSTGQIETSTMVKQLVEISNLGMSFFYETSTDINQSSNSNSSNNITQTHSMTFYQYTTFGINIPFMVIFPMLLVICIYKLISMRNEMKKNQKTIFYILIVFCASSFINMITRCGAELSFLSPDLVKAEEIYAVVKALDRTVISWTCYWEFLLLGHICLIL